jgi:hypothetical protein
MLNRGYRKSYCWRNWLHNSESIHRSGLRSQLWENSWTSSFRIFFHEDVSVCWKWLQVTSLDMWRAINHEQR